MRYVFRPWPYRGNDTMRLAAEAPYCAGEQGKFWEMCDWLFANVAEWEGVDDLVSLLVQQAVPQVGLDGAALGACLREERYRSRVEGLMARADPFVSGFPTFWVNGRLLAGEQSFDRFRQVIEEELMR